MERWRKYFESTGEDIWMICEQALMIAYADKEDEGSFAAKRDRLAQKLFAPEKLRMDPAPPLLSSLDSPNPGLAEGARLSVNNHNIFHHHHGSKTEEVSSDYEENRLQTPHGIYDEAEVLTEEMEQETLIKRDVATIKGILDSSQDCSSGACERNWSSYSLIHTKIRNRLKTTQLEKLVYCRANLRLLRKLKTLAGPMQMHSEKEILESLDRLNLMQLSVEILKDSEIGRSVNHLRKHPSKAVKTLAKKLVSDWKDLVDEWVKSVEDVANAALAGTPASVSLDEHGLPSPPIDGAALLAGTTRTSSVEMSQLLDFMDDDPKAGGAGYMQSPLEGFKRGEQKLLSDIHVRSQSTATSSISRVVKQSKEKEPLWTKVGPTNGFNPARPSNGSKGGVMKPAPERNRLGVGGVGGGSTSSTLLKHNPKEDDYNEKLLASKRKLQQNYQQAQTVRKQRTVQVMDLQDLPKGGGGPGGLSGSKSSHFPASNKPSSWARR